jgi:hypothetical protein
MKDKIKYQREYSKRLRLRAMMEINPFLTCECCGLDFYHAVLHIDHVEPLKQKNRQPNSIYLSILRNGRNGFQLLCANCNLSKRHGSQCQLIH